MLGNIQQSRKTLMQALWVGMLQNVLSKATKYALFDPTKEMSYIPLDKESKVLLIWWHWYTQGTLFRLLRL